MNIRSFSVVYLMVYSRAVFPFSKYSVKLIISQQKSTAMRMRMGEAQTASAFGRGPAAYAASWSRWKWRKDGKMEGWKGGRVEGWKNGRVEGWNTLLRWKWRVAQARGCEDFTPRPARRGNGLRGFSRHSEERKGPAQRSMAIAERGESLSARGSIRPMPVGGPEPSVTRDRIEGKG